MEYSKWSNEKLQNWSLGKSDMNIGAIWWELKGDPDKGEEVTWNKIEGDPEVTED